MDLSTLLVEIGRVEALAWRRLGTDLLAGRRYRAAVAALNEAVRCDPTDGGTWVTLGQAYSRIGRLTAARAALSIALANRGPSPETERGLSWVAGADQCESLGAAKRWDQRREDRESRERRILSEGGGVAEGRGSPVRNYPG